MAAFCWFLFVQPDLTWRILVVNFALGGVSLLAAAELRVVRGNGPTEKILLALALLSGLNFFEGRRPSSSRTDRSRAMTSSMPRPTGRRRCCSHALLSLLIALCLFTAAALDVMKALKAETHTDPLSGILNRRGFEERATLLLDQCRQGRISRRPGACRSRSLQGAQRPAWT
ncbi:hypothetical protein ACVOMV_05440 [Mesorhizobium atlanticum]